MRHLDLFSGIGGFALAAERTWQEEHELLAFCEIDEFCRKVLKKHWPDVPVISDIKNMKGCDYGAVDLISGGFPCQPFSTAGHQRGKEDDRWLWPEMLRIIDETRPSWIVGENVFGIRNMALDEVLISLENRKYTTETFDIPACACGAEHLRRRIWIIAHSEGIRLHPNKIQKRTDTESKIPLQCKLSELLADKECRYEAESAHNRTVDGLPETLDEHRLKALGNAIVPQAAQVIFHYIKELS